jgi:hypothetical protein
MGRTRATSPVWRGSVRCVLAFLKRRWLLLSYGIVLFGCTVINWARQKGVAPSHCFGVWRGHLFGTYVEQGFLFGPDNPYPPRTFYRFALHSPQFGGMPSLDSQNGDFSFAFPLWLPLSAVIGWIVFREMRWREKMRGKEIEL